MRQWVVVEMFIDAQHGEIDEVKILGIYGPFDHEGLAKAFAEAYRLQMQSHLIQVFELNRELK
jgi:hypothetical protein